MPLSPLFPTRGSLLARLRQSLLLLALGPLLLAFGLLLPLDWEHEREQLYGQYQGRVERSAYVLQSFLVQAENDLGAATRYWNYPALPVAEQKRILRDILANSQTFIEIDYLDAMGGSLHYVSKRELRTAPRQWWDEPAVAQALVSGGKHFGLPRLNPATGTSSMLLVLPLTDLRSGQLAGLLVGEMSLPALWQDLGRHVQGRGEDLFVVSATEQRIIAHHNPSIALASTHYRVPRSIGIYRDLQGRFALVASAHLDLPGPVSLSMVLTRPLVNAFSGLLLKGGVAVLALLLGGLLAWLLLRTLQRVLLDPLDQVTHAVQSLAGQDEAVPLAGHYHGEVATLAGAFNAMLARVQQARAELERRVAERTQLLSSANEHVVRSSRMLQTVIDAIPVRIFWKDRNLVYLGCNVRFVEDAGKHAMTEVIGKTDHGLSWSAMAGVYRTDDLEVLNTGQPKIGYEELQVTNTGQARWLRMSKVPLRDEAGHIIGVLGIYEDISAAKRIELDLRTAKDVAEQANRAKSMFLSSMSHELRTPLNAIMGYAQLLQMTDDLDDETLQNAHEIELAGQHLLELVNDVLDLARIEAGRMDFLVETLSLSAVLDECLSQNAPRADTCGVVVTVDDACRTQSLRADHRRLVQVFNNLISNAIKYNRPGGKVQVACTHPQAGRCRIAVTDTGPGLSPEQQAQLFQPFNRVGAEMSTIEGSGIGLTITRQLVEGMGGAIGVHSTQGEGSTFWVELPLPEDWVSGMQPEPGQVGVLTSVPVSAPALAAPARRVLVAEDYGPNQTVLRLQLESLGCQVDMAADGAAALQKWRAAGPYDLLLTDLNMPVMDGLALARAVRAQEQAGPGGRLPIVVVTAATEEVHGCREAGVDDVLTKPVTIDALRNLMERRLGSRFERGTPPPMPGLVPGAPMQDEAVFDLTALYQVLGEVGQGQARDLVEAFVDMARAGLDSLSVPLSDGQALAREMHKQKSAARTVGALRYARLAETLEHSAGSPGHAVPDIGAWLADLRHALDAVQLEARAAWARDAGAPLAPPPDSVPEAAHCGTVLVVDDDVVVRKQLPSMLQALGVSEVLTATNGIEAILALGPRMADLGLVVCDLNMPLMDGVELIRRFGQSGYKGYLILISGADTQILETARRLAELHDLNVIGTLSKPVLPQRMTELLKLCRMNRGLPLPPTRVQALPELTADSLRSALLGQQLDVWFQPKVDSVGLQPVGLEALARWPLADGSWVPPDLFITLAEREGLIGDLSRMLTERALQHAAQLVAAGYALGLSINLSGAWLDDLNLPELLDGLVHAAGLRTRDIVLEVTETGVTKDLTTALDVLTRLRLKGFGLSIDDFGIGYSSVEQLARIPFTELKLDRSFVHKGQHNPAARAILESSMGMARRLGLGTVAEGVEDADDLALVREFGCDFVQGYLVARPMPIDELLVWLARTATRKTAGA